MLCLSALPARAEPAVPVTPPLAPAPVILILGDSLGAAFGVPRQRSWPVLLQARLQEQGYRYRVVNASISGDTTAGGLARLPALLKRDQPKWLLLELGANDGLRALPLAQMRANLTKMIEMAGAAGAQTLLFEMYIPTNYGPEYTQGFTQSFRDVAQASGATLVPFWMQAIATDPKAFQSDGLHPNAGAQPAMLDGVWPTLQKALGEPPR
ncbi:MAG TPA: arylesterase [Fontimonas sp.]